MSPAQGNTATGGTGKNAGALKKSRAETIYGNPDTANELLADYLYIVLGSISAALMAWRLATLSIMRVRTMSCLNNETQQYFVTASPKLSWFKRNILYSPIFRKRHNREFQLSSAMNVGTLPTRLQLVFLLGYFTTNIVFCVIAIDFSGSLIDVAPLIRKRTGVLATINMVPLFLMAGRNNPLIHLLGISFDTFNLLHRWFGRIVVLEALVHTFGFLISMALEEGWASALNTTITVPYIMWGFVATCAFVVILTQAASIFRHAFYETFKIFHISLAALSIIGLYYHLDLENLSQIVYVYPVIILWVFDHSARLIRLARNGLGTGNTKALVEALPGGACRLTVEITRPWGFRPGQHAYLYMPCISYWQSHPFSVAWSEGGESLNSDKLPTDCRETFASTKTTLSFVIRGRTGFTGSLYNKASGNKDGKLMMQCFVEGPYGGIHIMRSYGTVMLFAGGIGITQAVSHVRDLVVAYRDGTAATRKTVLVWTFQSSEHFNWILPWLVEILNMEKSHEMLRIKLFLSQPHSAERIRAPKDNVHIFSGRPDINALIGQEIETQVGTMGVSVCGPGAISDEVRKAVRNRQYQGSIDFIEEAFSW